MFKLLNASFLLGCLVGAAGTAGIYTFYKKVMCRPVPIEAKPKKKEPEIEVTETLTPTDPFDEKTVAEYKTMAQTYNNDPDFAKDDEGEIEIISQEEYDNQTYPYDHLELYLYTDGVMATEDDEIVHALDLVGPEALRELDAMTDGSIFVRNPKMSSEYAVTKLRVRYVDITGEKLVPLSED